MIQLHGPHQTALISAGDTRPLATFSRYARASFARKGIANFSSVSRFQRFAPRPHRRFDLSCCFRCFMLTLTHLIETWKLRGGRSRLRWGGLRFPDLVITRQPIATLRHEARPTGYRRD